MYVIIHMIICMICQCVTLQSTVQVVLSDKSKDIVHVYLELESFLKYCNTKAKQKYTCVSGCPTDLPPTSIFLLGKKNNKKNKKN